MPTARRALTTLGNRAGSTARMSKPTLAAPVASSSAWIARATSSRGASSSTKRSPAASWSVAPSPRIASVTRKPSERSGLTSAVGWNCMSSRSARAAPARRASSMPLPNAPGGLVVRDHIAAAPPVARTTARAATVRPSSQTRPTQRPPVVQSSAARRRSSTSMAGSRATRDDSSRLTRRPVALPPAWTTRRTECPPSRPSARRPNRSASKRTPSDTSSRTRSGASSQRVSAADWRTSPRPAAIVSATCCAGESSIARAAASPPWAQ